MESNNLFEIIQMSFKLSLHHFVKFNNQEQMYIREKGISRMHNIM